MSIIACIPARLQASRFPNKPLAKLHGIPMVGHVYHRVKLCKAIDDVYVATCDQAIYDYIVQEGGKAIMTKDTHEGCIDRCAEALYLIEKERKETIEIMTVVQGDEPMVFPEMIDAAILGMQKDPTIQVANLMAPLSTDEEIQDPNEIKVVVTPDSEALYFSREPIPSIKKAPSRPQYNKQVCIIPFRRDFLIQFSQMKRTPLEISESIDMLRVLENNYKVKMIPTPFRTWSVDTPFDLERVEKLMQNDLLMKKYAQTSTLV